MAEIILYRILVKQLTPEQLNYELYCFVQQLQEISGKIKEIEKDWRFQAGENGYINNKFYIERGELFMINHTTKTDILFYLQQQKKINSYLDKVDELDKKAQLVKQEFDSRQLAQPPTYEESKE
jgi:prefoldin subunit 5